MESNNFEDPALKALLKRVGERHRASDELRASVERILTGEVAGHIQPVGATKPRGGIVRRFAFAVAALVLIGVTVSLVAREVHRRHELAEQAQYIADNRSLIDAMLADQGDGRSFSLPTDLSVSARAAQLSEEVGTQVRLPDLAPQGYELRDASVVSLGDVRAARGTYVDVSGKSIRIYQLPFDAFQKVDAGDIYSLKTDRQLIAGTVDEDGVRCIVSDNALETDRAFSILQHFRS